MSSNNHFIYSEVKTRYALGMRLDEVKIYADTCAEGIVNRLDDDERSTRLIDVLYFVNNARVKEWSIIEQLTGLGWVVESIKITGDI